MENQGWQTLGREQGYACTVLWIAACAPSRKSAPVTGLMLIAGLFAGLVTCLVTGPAASAPVESTNPVRGVVRPKTQASISSDLAVAVRRTPLLEGQRFRRGDLLVSFDCRRYEAEYEAAKAQHHEAELTATNSAYLNEHKALGKYELEIARARAQKAAADMAAVSVHLDQCSLVAPYDGRVAELLVHEHETPQPGKPLLTILADQEMEIELIVPSHWLAWLEAGAKFSFSIDETQSQHAAHIDRLGAAVDPVSQTIKIVGRFETVDAKILAGMSGTAAFAGAGN